MAMPTAAAGTRRFTSSAAWRPHQARRLSTSMTISSGSSRPAACMGPMARDISGTDREPKPPANPPLETPVM